MNLYHSIYIGALIIIPSEYWGELEKVISRLDNKEYYFYLFDENGSFNDCCLVHSLSFSSYFTDPDSSSLNYNLTVLSKEYINSCIDNFCNELNKESLLKKWLIDNNISIMPEFGIINGRIHKDFSR